MTSPRIRPNFLQSLNCDGKYGAGLAICLALLLIPLAGGEELRMAWRYERTAIAAGQWWRLITAHVIHMDTWHAVLNSMGLALLWALFARCYRLVGWLIALVVIVACIDLGFWFFSKSLHWYVGASASLHGIFACGCIALIRQGDRSAYVAALVFVAKLAWEQLHGPLPLETAHPVATVSHAYGALGGLVAALLLGRRHEPL